MYKRCEAGEALIGSKHELNITYPAPRETLLETPVMLPISEPATPTFSYTVLEDDLPTFDGKPYSVVFAALLYAGGKNMDAASTRTLCYRIKKNGVSIATATNLTVVANQYWTLNMANSTSLQGCEIGDVIDIYLWQITPDTLNWDYSAFCVIPTRVFVSKANQVLYNVKYILPIERFPILTSGTATVRYGRYTVFTVVTTGNANYDSVIISSETVITALKQHDIYGLYCSLDEPYNDLSINASASNRPYYNNNFKVTKIEWYPTALEV